MDGDTAVQEGHAINGTLTPTATYFNGMYRRDDVTATVRWYVFDGLGSVIGEVDPSGNLTCNRGFDVYGATRSQTGTPTSKHGFVGKLGHETEDACALEYMRARWYDPACGRFVSEDPGRDGRNWFRYCKGNPVNHVDADGRVSANLAATAMWWCGLAIIAAYGGMASMVAGAGGIAMSGVILSAIFFCKSIDAYGDLTEFVNLVGTPSRIAKLAAPF